MKRRLLRTADVAKLLDVDPINVRRWCQEGRGPAYIRTPAGHYRFRPADVEAWAAKLESRGGHVCGGDACDRNCGCHGDAA
jgi:excisionase family DNA binding protein